MCLCVLYILIFFILKLPKKKKLLPNIYITRFILFILDDWCWVQSDSLPIVYWYHPCKFTCDIHVHVNHLIKSMFISSSVWLLFWCIFRASPGPFDHIVPPPPDIQPVIDRMAMYVAKNGIEFEIVVKSKNDPRFQFLLPHHVHFPYYDFKKQIHMRVRWFLYLHVL